MRSIVPLLCCLLFAIPAAAKKAPAAADEAAADEAAPADSVGEVLPPAGELIAAASAALGGGQGGQAALEALPGYRLTFAMDVNDTWAGKSFRAKHVYTRGLDASIKLEVDVVSGDGKDSVAYTGAEEAWVEADGERTDFTADEVLARVDDFGPQTLFQVPLDLAARGIEALPAAVHDRLTAERVEGEEEGERVVVSAVDGEGEEQVRLLLDVETHLPLEASFASTAGRITYRFGDYREVSPGLILPHSRTFLRNGVTLSELSVSDFQVLGEPSGPRRDGNE